MKPAAQISLTVDARADPRRLAKTMAGGLARWEATRQVMMVLAFKWRRLAKMAEERKGQQQPGDALEEMFWKRG